MSEEQIFEVIKEKGTLRKAREALKALGLNINDQRLLVIYASRRKQLGKATK
jgi:hypothetical protein